MTKGQLEEQIEEMNLRIDELYEAVDESRKLLEIRENDLERAYEQLAELCEERDRD